MECALPRFKKQSYVFRRPWYLRLKILDQELAAEIFFGKWTQHWNARETVICYDIDFVSQQSASKKNKLPDIRVCHVMWWTVLQFSAQEHEVTSSRYCWLNPLYLTARVEEKEACLDAGMTFEAKIEWCMLRTRPSVWDKTLQQRNDNQNAQLHCRPLCRIDQSWFVRRHIKR